MSSHLKPEKLKLKTLLGDYPNTMALKNGVLRPKLFDFEFDPVKTPNRAFKRVVRELEFDVAELALVTYLQAKAYGKPLALLPAVVGEGRFQHHCLVYNAERGKVTVAQLNGKRVGIRAHAQTTVTWVRGVLANDYGVDLPKVQWVTFEHGHLAEFPDPKGFERAPEGSKMVDMLLSGELDAAIIGSDLPDDPRLQPVLPDPHDAAQAWSRRLQMLPINHMMAIDMDLCKDRPDVIQEVYQVLAQSKAMAKDENPRRSVHAVKGEMDLTPFGIEPNRKALDVLIRYTYQQGLIPRPYSVDELFDETRDLLGK
jgi:4,5-dihydroxyphthalate decarboxylase